MTVLSVLNPVKHAQGSKVQPLLLWLDDEPKSIQALASLARLLGIRVVTLLSTAATKIWIASNDGMSPLTFTCSSCIEATGTIVRSSGPPSGSF